MEALAMDRVMDARVTQAGAIEGRPKEGAEWVLVGMLVLAAVSPLIGLAAVLWAEREQKRRDAWEAEHPHEQVEPPRVPEHYRHVEREALEALERDALAQIHETQPAAPDHDPAIGDVVTTFVEHVVDGERVRDWIVARVVWPRETYVRARVDNMGTTAAKVVSNGDMIDVPRDTIASVLRLTGPAPEPVEKPPRWGKKRRRVKEPAQGPKPQARPSEPVEPVDQTPSTPPPEPADSETASTPAPTQRGSVVARTALSDGNLRWIASAVKHQWPTRPHGPELVPEPGDDVTFMVYARDEADEPVADVLAGRIQAVRDDTLDIEVLGNLTKQGLGVPKVGHGYMAGDVMSLDRRAAISIIKPAPPVVAKSRLAAKSRLKRYRVQVGELIELRPDTIPELPPDAAWEPSRPDVAVRVLEQDSSRSVVALDGPAGPVNVALVTSTSGKPRTVCSWKFEIAEKTTHASDAAASVGRDKGSGQPAGGLADQQR